MAENQDKCVWIKLNKTTICGAKLSKVSSLYCSYHTWLTNSGGENHVCSECGIGVKSKFNFCKYHGLEFKRRRMQNYNNANFDRECNRLRKIKY